jgi:hypothetical protein
MGLEIKIDAQEKKDYFLVFDCTGSYSSENKGGYGGANQKITDVLKATLFVQGPSDTEEYPHEIDITGALPNKEDIGFQVLPILIGQTNNEIESGKYKLRVVYEVRTNIGNTQLYYGATVVVFVNNITCCIDKHGNDINENLFSDPKQKKIAELNLLLKGVNKQIDNGLYDKANETIDYMKLQCKCSEC